jgi:hypothetical protein
MLKVIGHKEIRESSLEIDGYVPLSFRCWEVRSKTAIPLYWRFGNLKTTLIEIGISQENGAIFDVTVVSLSEILNYGANDDDYISENIPVISGLPVCEIKPTDELTYFDEKREIISGLRKDSIVIWIGDKTEESTVYKAGRLMFGVNSQNEICCLRVDHLDEEELKNFLFSTQPPRPA